MRTEQLKNFEKSLSELNDSYSHYIFVWEQFSIDHEKTLKKHPKNLTSETFSNNSNGKQFNVLLEYLDKSHNETQNLILQSIYQLAYGYFENYLIQLHRFGKKLNPQILDLEQKLEVETIDNTKLDKVFNRLNIDSKKAFETLDIKTLDYIRLRRNRITHRASEVQGVLLGIINNDGTKLNDFWDKNLKNKRYNVDFKRKVIDEFDKIELFDFFNIYRKLVRKIDQAFINEIGLTTFTKYIYNKFIEVNGRKIKGLKDERKKAKFRRFCKLEFGYDISENELGNITF